MEAAFKFLDSISLSKRLDRREAFPIVSIAAATSVLYASYRLLRDNRRHTKGLKEIPVPSAKVPYFGHLITLGDMPGNKITEWHKELGPILELHMGIQTWVSVDDPELAHKIFVRHGTETSYRPPSIYTQEYYSMHGKGIASSQPGNSWKLARSAALSVLAPKQIENYMDSIHREARDAVTGLMECTEKEGCTNPLKYFELSALNVVFTAAFGRRFESVNDPEFVDMSEMIEVIIKYGGIENDLANFLPFMTVVDYLTDSMAKMKSFISDQRDPVYRKLIEEAEHRDGPNVVKSLKENGFEFTDDETLVFMSDLITGGTDTVSVTLSWNAAVMCHYPEVQKRCAAEIDEFIREHGRVPTFKERSALPFCIATMKECMRFRPTTPFGLPHCVRDDVDVDGYIIPKGSVLICNMKSMHKNPELYPEPERFYPERFLNNTKTMQSAANGKLAERDHFNFGWGRRLCPAVYLAEVEIFNVFIQTYARCFLEPADDGMPDIIGAKNAGLTLLPLPFHCKFVRRTDALV